MTLALLVYLAGVLSNLAVVMVGIGIASCALIGGSMVGMIDRRDTTFQWKLVKRGIACALTAFGLCVFIPSEKTMYVMAGAYAAQQVAENPNVQKLSGKVITIIDQKLDKIIEDGVEEAKKAAGKAVKEKTEGK